MSTTHTTRTDMVPDGLTSNAATVYTAVHAQPGQTPAELARTTGLGRSTVAKILVALETAHLAHRERGTFAQNGRQPDRWHPKTNSLVETGSAPGHEGPSALEHAQDPAQPGQVEQNDETERSVETETPESHITDADDPGESPTDAQPAEMAEPCPATEPARDVADGEAPPAEATDELVAPQPTGRLGQGGLRALVLDYLQTHPEDPASPTKIARALGRSSGAVANALVTLVNLGQAEMVAAKPRTYRLSPPAALPK